MLSYRTPVTESDPTDPYVESFDVLVTCGEPKVLRVVKVYLVEVTPEGYYTAHCHVVSDDQGKVTVSDRSITFQGVGDVMERKPRAIVSTEVDKAAAQAVANVAGRTVIV